MARKRPSAVQNHSAEPDKTVPDAAATSAAAAAADRKLASLKTLNDILLKQTVELREKESLAADAAFVSSLESEISLLVVSSGIAAEQIRLDGSAAAAEAEKDEINKSLQLAVSEREEIAMTAEELRAEVKVKKEMETERAELVDEVKSVRGDFGVLKREKEEAEKRYILQIDEMRKEIRELAGEREERVEQIRRLEAEVISSKYAFESVKEEMDALTSVRVEFNAMKKEKEQLERSFEAQKKELAKQLDVLGKKTDELSAKNDEIERDRAEQGVVIAKQAEEIQSLALAREGLEAEVRNSKDAFDLMKEGLEQERVKILDKLRNVQVTCCSLEKGSKQMEENFKMQLKESALRLDDVSKKMRDMAVEKDAIERRNVEQGVVIASQVKELRSLALARDRCEDELKDFKESYDLMKEELEGGRAKLVDQLNSIRMDFDNLNKEKEQSEQSLKSHIDDLVEKLDDLMEERAELDETISTQAEEHKKIAIAKEEMQIQLRSLKDTAQSKEIELRSLNDRVHSLEEMLQGHAKVLDELESVHVDFDVLKKDKEQSEQRFKLEAVESAKHLDALTKELGELAALKDASGRERAEQEVEIARLKIDLQHLQTKVPEAHRELTVEREKADGLKSQVAELENSKSGVEEEFARAKAEHERDIAQLMNKMDMEIAEARKKNGRFFAWFVPAATTATCLLAAGFTSYKLRSLSYKRQV